MRISMNITTMTAILSHRSLRKIGETDLLVHDLLQEKSGGYPKKKLNMNLLRLCV